MLWISWVDDNIIVGTQKAVDNGMKTIKFTQPVQVQSLEDEFDLNGIRTPVTPEDAIQYCPRETPSTSYQVRNRHTTDEESVN